ncbi:MAG: DUF1127 domain-containing protein [Kiloniellales bacterium]
MEPANSTALRISLPDRRLARERRSGLSALLAWAWLYLQRRRQRRVLAELPDHLLKDIGITRREARMEARRPFWK